jgi:Domain of unknown function (DUF927)
MDKKTFLEAVLGETGHYCVFAYRGPRHVQTMHGSIDELVTRAESLDADGWDTFFALATFTNDKSREAANAQQLKAFFLDIDCGEGKPYPNQTEGFKALRTFCKAVDLPKPTVISSGRGLHVYWRLSEAVTAKEWKAAAEAFKRACRVNKFDLDYAVPADMSRVLRVPYTHHYKDNPPKLVHMVGDLEPAVTLQMFTDRFGSIERSSASEGEPTSLADAILGNFNTKFKQIMLRTAEGKGCPQLGHIVKNQSEIEEPLWRAGLSIAWLCADKDTAIHKMSNKHPDYSPDVTVEKAALTKGPYLCETFNTLNPGVCESCEHWQKIKSPIVLGRYVEEAEEPVVADTGSSEVSLDSTSKFLIPKYPDPYFQGKGGGVFRRGADKSGAPKDVMVYHNPLYMVSRIRDPEHGETCLLRLHLPRDGVREFTIPLAHVGSAEEFRSTLAKQGVAVVDSKELQGYIMKWVNELQYKVEAAEARTQFGWTGDDMKSFIIGDKEIFADRIGENPPSQRTIDYFPYFKPKGTLDDWKRIMQFYGRPGMEAYQFMIGMSFGAPLMQFFPVNAFQFHMVWGNPEKIVLKEDDTVNSRMHRIEVFKNIPVPMDELTNMKPLEASDVTYAIHSGQQRNRLSSKGNLERYRGLPWRTTVPTTGNAGIVEKISIIKAMPKAEAQRILEYQPKAISFSAKSETDAIAALILSNYGHAAIPYLQYIMKDVSGARDVCMATQKRIDEYASLKAENRFWSVGATISLSGLMLAKKCGLIDWEIKPIAQWAINTLGNTKRSVMEMTSDEEAILRDYLADHYNDILRIKSSVDLRKTVAETLVHPEATPRSTFVARYEYDVKKLYLLIRPLKSWCAKQQISYSGLIEKLRVGKTKANKQKVRLSRGTHMNMPAADVWVMDFSGFSDDDDQTQNSTTVPQAAQA